MSTFEDILQELTDIIKAAYEQGVTMAEAERLAARTLTVRLELSDLIKTKDLDARMKRHGVKAIRSKAYMDEIVKHDKKPNESYLEAAINKDPLVEAAELLFAEAETTKNRLESYLEIFKDSHHYFKAIMKGSYEG